MRVVVVTPDLVGRRMAGPGMRAHHFASELSKEFDTALVARFDDQRESSAYRPVHIGSPQAVGEIADAEVVIGQPTRFLLRHASRSQILFFDLFDPVILELRELYGPRPRLRQRLQLMAESWRLKKALERGRAIITASAAQRRFYEQTLRRSDLEWIEIPFGVEQPPEPLSKKDDPPMLLWGGGVWAWLDPELAIDAVEEVNRRGVPCRLTILGGNRPGLNSPHASFRDQVKGRAERSAVVDWHDEWIDYDQRWQWLHRAKIAIMLHRRTPESELSIRTRLFDAIGAAVPVVASSGGWAADYIRATSAGVVVEPSDRNGVVTAIETLLKDDAFYRAAVVSMETSASAMRWPLIARPLLDAVRRAAPKIK